MPSLGGWEFVILIGVLVLVFGARKLPDMARSIGQSARVFKGEMKGMKTDEQTRPAEPPKSAELPPAQPPTPAPTSTQPPPPAAQAAPPLDNRPGQPDTTS